MSKTTNIYKIGCHEESGGVFNVNAVDEQSARAIAQQLLDDKGFDPSLDGFSVKHGLREVDSVEYVGEQTTIPFDAFTAESAKTIEGLTEAKVNDLNQSTLDVAEQLEAHPMIQALISIRDSDQLISIGGDGCEVMQTLRDNSPYLVKKLEKQDSCYDKLDAIIDMCKILIAENTTLVAYMQDREEGVEAGARAVTDLYEKQVTDAIKGEREDA